VSGLKPRCEGARLAVTQPQVDVDRVGFPFSGYGIAETKRRERIRPKMKEFPANSRLSANWRQRLVDLELVAPVTDPGLGIDQFQNAHALEIGHRPLARERPLQRHCVDDSTAREATAEQALANRIAKMIEQPRREPARSTLHAAIDDQPRKVGSKGAARQRSVATARAPLPGRHFEAGFDDGLR